VISTPAVNDLAELAGLYEAYRAFYACAPDPDAARSFVRARVAAGDTQFFLAREDGAAVGFVHLTPAWDTLNMQAMWSLDDLYVAPEARRAGIGSALLERAEEHARATHASRITLSTAHTNADAQRLYLKHRYVLDEKFRYYHRKIT
jgi:ribosomal protein S18 acetylase RimI-like enzyme